MHPGGVEPEPRPRDPRLKWGTAQPITIRDKDYGPIRIRGFGNYSYGVREVEPFWRHVTGTFERFYAADLEGQLRARVLTEMAALQEAGHLHWRRRRAGCWTPARRALGPRDEGGPDAIH